MSTASGARQGAVWAAGQLDASNAALMEYLRAAGVDVDALLASGQADQLTSLGEGLDLSLASLYNAQEPAHEELNAGYSAAQGAVGSGYDSAIARLDPYAQGGAKAWATMQDATGLNGAEGNTRAAETFHASPGYQYQVDQALDGVMRKQSATGALASGNTLVGLEQTANHLADKEWSDWYDRVNGISNTGYDAVNKQSGFDVARGKDMASLFVGNGKDAAGLYTDFGTKRAGLYDTNAGREAGVVGNTTSLGVQSKTALTGKAADAQTANAQAIAKLGAGAFAAGDKAASDQENMWLNLAKLGTGLAGGWAGSTSGSATISNWFK